MSSSAGQTTFYRVYPAPPPTVNSLTSRQKAQLRRSTTKLTKMLGAAPQVIDEHSGHIKVSFPLPLSSVKRMQPTLSVSLGERNTHRRSRSATDRIDPDLYPLSSALRPVKQSRRHPSQASSSTSSSDLDSVTFPPGLRRTRSRSMSASYRDGKDEKRGMPGDVVPPLPSQARPRPEKERPESFSRDSLCDSLYEPSFTIPSPSKLRREKMARICKLLGEDVPIDLVFPTATEENDADYDLVLDIRPSSPVLPTNEIPPPLPPKLVVVQKPEQPKWTSYRTTALETIVEQSPRSSCSSNFSTGSTSSFLTTTTSSSYRFTSSGCASAPPSYSSHDSTQSSQMTQSTYEAGGSCRSREFAIYVPSQRRMSELGCGADIEKSGAQEFEVVTAMVDIRV